MLIIGDGILEATDKGGGHDAPTGGKPGSLVGYDRLEPVYKLDAADDTAMLGG